jgi:hypothetical protein
MRGNGYQRVAMDMTAFSNLCCSYVGDLTAFADVNPTSKTKVLTGIACNYPVFHTHLALFQCWQCRPNTCAATVVKELAWTCPPFSTTFAAHVSKILPVFPQTPLEQA